jgi:transcriptional regulator with XRE-family HTH domain
MDPRDLRQAFAANLRRFRHAKGVSQEDLAYEADVNRTYVSKLEKGVSYPGLEIIAKLANALGVEPAELLMLPPRRGQANSVISIPRVVAVSLRRIPPCRAR